MGFESYVCNCDDDCDNLLPYNSSPRSSHIWLSYIYNFGICFVDDIWNKPYMNYGNEMEMKKWSSQWMQFKPLTLGAGQLWVHMFPWTKWVLMIYEINHIWAAEMKWKWRNDRRSECNLSNCVKKPEKKFRTSTGFEPVTSRYRCHALPTELWSHWRWEQVNCGFICSRERNEC